jgi:hypothetical protein
MFAAALTFVVFWASDQLGARGLQLGIVSLVQVVVAPAIPIAAGIAIVRYRLYEIDRLINRTLVYGLLTGLLGAVYAATVVSLGQVFGGIGATPPTWAVAGATLAVAALFQPARRRIQRAVDHRFNRRHHDAAKTIDAFNARLRDEVDLDTLSTELVAVVDQTMEPTAVSLAATSDGAALRSNNREGSPRSPLRHDLARPLRFLEICANKDSERCRRRGRLSRLWVDLLEWLRPLSLENLRSVGFSDRPVQLLVFRRRQDE